MNFSIDEKGLQTALSNIEEKMNRLNDEKIVAFFVFLGLDKRDDIPQDYLQWETILIVVPNRHISNEIKKYKYAISRISFVTNPYAQQIHIFDFNQWENSIRNKTQFQKRELLKTNFGGVKKTGIDPE